MWIDSETDKVFIPLKLKIKVDSPAGLITAFMLSTNFT